MTRTILKIGIIIVLMAFAFFGCKKNETDQEKLPTYSSAISGQLKDFFPTQVGLKWTYEITIGDADPLRYNETSWPQDKGVVNSYIRGRIFPVNQGEGKKRFTLIIRSRASAANIGTIEHLNGVELEVVQDELGIFEDAKQVFWAISTEDRFVACLVVTYDPMSHGAPKGDAWGRLGQGDGSSMRLLFFGERPGIQLGIGEKPTDKLLFVGPDTNVEGYAGQALLHFTRSVEGTKGDQYDQYRHEIDRAFTEEMWYAKGKGLVRLVQKVGGNISMTWALSTVSE